MGRIYTAQFNTAVTAVQDLIEIVAPADASVRIHEIELGNITEIGDAMEEMLSLAWKSGQTTTGSGGSALAEVPLLISDAAAGTTTFANNTTVASAGTIVTHGSWAWNIRVPFQKLYTPETRPVLAPSRRATLELLNTPTDSITIVGTITFEEIG